MNTVRTTQIAVLAVALSTGIAFAHCDTTGGPVIPEAKAALEKGDVSPGSLKPASYGQFKTSQSLFVLIALFSFWTSAMLVAA